MNRGSRLYESTENRSIRYDTRLSDGLYLSSCGVEHCLPEQRLEIEEKAGYFLYVVLSGRGKLSVNGIIRDLHFGQLFIIKPGNDIWFEADKSDPWMYCWMEFDGSIAKKCIEESGFTDGIHHLDCNLDPLAFYVIVCKALDHTQLDISNIYLRTGLLLEYLSVAIDSKYKPKEKSLYPHSKYVTDDYVTFTANFINENYDTAKITEIAKLVGLHRSYLTSIFKQKMGMSPQTYLMQCRMSIACKLLKETFDPIQEISRQVGYDNALTFSKTFKNFYGLSPRAYRLKNKNSEIINNREK